MFKCISKPSHWKSCITPKLFIPLNILWCFPLHTKYNLQYRYGIEINCNFPRYSYIQISMVMPCKFPHHRSILHVLSRHTAEGVRLLNSIFHRKMLEYTTQSHAVLRKISIGLMFTSEIITLHQCKHSGNTSSHQVDGSWNLHCKHGCPQSLLPTSWNESHNILGRKVTDTLI